VHDGEKIYKLSDLFVPKDEKIIKKIERYNSKIMSISEKEKYEKEHDAQKKEINDTEEIKQIIKKAKRNQKFTKINITYDEKFFDRTHFLENIHATTLAHQEIVLLENKELIKKQILQEGLLKSFGIVNEKKIEEEIIERNLLNALFYVKIRLSEKEKIGLGDYIEERENYGAEEYLNFKIADGRNCDSISINKNKIMDFNTFDYTTQQHLQEFDRKNPKVSDFSFSQITSDSHKNCKKLLLSQNIEIDPNDFEEVIKIESKSDNKNKNCLLSNKINKQDSFGIQTTFFNELSEEKEAFLHSVKEKVLNAKSEEETKSLGKNEKISFEEAEILKLNSIIKENVERNMKFNPEDLKHDKYLMENTIHYNHKKENSSFDYNKINNGDYDNNNLNDVSIKDKNYLNVQSTENDLCDESNNNLMDLDYINQNNHLEMDFDNLINFSFQNKKVNFTNTHNKILQNSSENDNPNLLNNTSTININNKINKNLNLAKYNRSQSQNVKSIPEFIVNINKLNTFSSNINSKDSKGKNSMIYSKENNINNDSKKRFSASKSKYSNTSNDEYNQENEDYENFEENEEQEENEENSDDSEEDKDKIIPKDIFETKEFKIFHLHESALLKSTPENENIIDNNCNSIVPKEEESDNFPDFNNLSSQKILDFKFNKPFPNVAKEKSFLHAQIEETIQSHKQLKTLSSNNITEPNFMNPNIQGEVNPYPSLNNLIVIRDLEIKQTMPYLNKENEFFFKKQYLKKPEKEFLGLKKERDIADDYDLYNKFKCNKYKKQAFYNEFLQAGEYLSAIVLSEEDLKNPKHKYFDISKKIFDLNDYNMNFEILKIESLYGNRINKDKDSAKEGAERKGRNESSPNTIAIDLGTGFPQTKAEISLRDAELITEPLPILPLNEDVSKQNLLIMGLNSSANAIKDIDSKVEMASSVLKENINNNLNNNIAHSFLNNFNNNYSYLNNSASPEDFFTSFQSRLNTNTNSALNQNFLKIGKAKGNLLTHAKCSYNLTYNKINLTYDDFRDFHRPNFCKYLLREKKKKNFSFSISEKYNISKGERLKRWDCAILTRNFLKKQEKKRISKNIQYMNAYEIFKDRHKLSLNDGKYALFEHIDEYPLFVSNFGMASKLKKFLYTPKIFNINVANPNTRLSDVELKTYNITGPYGSQILLQPNQKLPLVGQIDLNELKGMSVFDNKMFRSPVFYEKVKNPVLLKTKSVSKQSEQKDNEKENVLQENFNNANNKKFNINNQDMNDASNNNKTNFAINNLNSNNNENSTRFNSHSHHTQRRNILSINLNNNPNNSNGQIKIIKHKQAEKDSNNNIIINNLNINKNLNTNSDQNLNCESISKLSSNLINIGDNISIDPSSLQITEGKNGKKYYNFLLTFKKSKEGKESFTIRELEHSYTVAQEEPKIEVYPPQSRQYNNFLKKKIQTYTYKLYDEIGYKRGINFKEFTNLFPNVTEQILKKNFREMNIEIDKNICFFTKIPSEDNHMLINPENICQFESCQFGIYKLREVGIKNITNPDKISYATNKFIGQTPDPKQQFLARVTEEELLTTPWNITQNFLQAKQIKGMLAIKGIGDPSNGQGGYSFLKMPVKNYNDNKTLKEEIDILKNANKNIKTVTGTDADLRKLSKDDIKMKLIQLGQDEEIINKLSRWERVSLLRYRSSQAAQMVIFAF